MEKDKLFSPYTLLLILAGLLINMLGVKLALYFAWPLFLDSVGTIAVAALGGYLPGIVVGFLSNALNSFSDPITLYYGIISVMFALLSAQFSLRGVFCKPGKTLLSILPFALIGGGLGSLLTWLLYGFDFGTGISAPIAYALLDRLGLSKFYAQFIADMGIDLFDKLVTLLLIFLLLKFLPEKWLDKLPLGHIYKKQAGRQPSVQALAHPERFFRRYSLRSKVVSLIISTAIILGAIAVSISFVIYSKTMNQRYIERGEDAVSMMLCELDADAIAEYAATNTVTPAYLETEQRLVKIKSGSRDIKYMYVYRIRPDGCQVIFDLDTADTPGGELGDIIPQEEAFAPYREALLHGEEIPPVISNGVYGWLLTVYKPVHNSAGECVAYAAADIPMSGVISDRYAFVIKIVSLLFGATILITAFAIWFAQKRLVSPINALAAAASQFAYESESERRANVQSLQALRISTGDEIENLYDAMSKTFADIGNYLTLIDEKSADIAQKAETITRMQNNVIMSFASMIESRDEATGGHIQRTANYVRLIGEALEQAGQYPALFTQNYLDNLSRSAPLHDIGKIKIPDAILNKPGKLTREEFALIKTHTTAGNAILRDAMAGIQDNNYLSEAAAMAMYHHERWDGAGYPRGLCGEEIPLCARIMAVADVFDALLSKRSYKEPYPFAKAVDIIKEEAGKQFDPTVVAAFLQVLPEVRRMSEH